MDLIRRYVADEHRRRDVLAARGARERELRRALAAARHPELASGFLLLDDGWAARVRTVQSQRALTTAALCHALEQVQEAEVRARAADVAVSTEGTEAEADPAAERVAAWWWCVLRHAHRNAVHRNLCVSPVPRSSARPRAAPPQAHPDVVDAVGQLREAEQSLRAWTAETDARLAAVAGDVQVERLVEALVATGDGSARVRVGLSDGQSRSYHMTVSESVRKPVATAAHLRRADTRAEIEAHIGALHDAREGGDVRTEAERLLTRARTVGAVTTRGVSMRRSRPTL